jgi:putative MATE family efflux protein
MRELHTGDIRSHIMHLSWPIILGNLFQNLASVYELFLLGRIGLEALAAISIVMSSVYALYLSVNGGLINAAIAITSRYAGGKKYDQLNRAVVQMFIFGIFAFAVYGALIFFFMDQILTFFGAKGNVLIMAKQYTMILALTAIPMAFYAVGLGVLRGAGDSMFPLKLVSIMMVVNIIANTVFIIIFKLGLEGAALTGLLMFTASMGIMIFVFFRGKHYFKIRLSDLKIDREYMLKYASLAVKSIAQGFTGDIGSLVLLKIVAGYGNAMIAAYGIVGKLIYYIMMFCWPIGNSASAVVGHNLGQKFYDRARLSVTEAVKLLSMITIPASVIFFVFAGPIIAVFSSDAAVSQFGIYYLRVIAPVLAIIGLGSVLQSAFNGAGHTGVPTFVTFVAYILVRLSLAFIFPRYMGGYGVFWAVSISYVVFTGIFIVLYRQKKWMMKEI